MLPILRRLSFAFLLLASLCAGRLDAAPAQGPQVATIFLKLDGIAGGSTDEKHAGEIELASFNWSIANKEKGKPEPHDALVLKAIDATTPKLAEACAGGQRIKEAVVTIRAFIGGKALDAVQYVFTDVQISVVSHTVIQRAEEQVQFRYRALEVRYSGPDGKTVSASTTQPTE